MPVHLLCNLPCVRWWDFPSLSSTSLCSPAIDYGRTQTQFSGYPFLIGNALAFSENRFGPEITAIAPALKYGTASSTSEFPSMGFLIASSKIQLTGNFVLYLVYWFSSSSIAKRSLHVCRLSILPRLILHLMILSVWSLLLDQRWELFPIQMQYKPYQWQGPVFHGSLKWISRV